LKAQKLYRFILLVLVNILIFNPLLAQDKSKLEDSKKKIEAKIQYTKKLLNETKNLKRNSINEISLLNSQIKNRANLIVVLNTEIVQTESSIVKLSRETKSLEEQLKKLKLEYGNLIYQSYKSSNQYDQWMFILASEDFYQAFNRVKYLQEINEFRREKAEKISKKEMDLRRGISELQKSKNDRLNLMVSKKVEAESLVNDKNIKQQKVKSFSQKELELRKELAAQKNEWDRLNQEVKKTIAKKINKVDVKSGKVVPLTSQESALSQNFIDNKGKLPWPSERGQLVGKFGLQQHPTLSINIDNKGIDIRCEKGAMARTVFEGKVVSVLQLPKFMAVIIQHGSYFTVYSNLTEVTVSEGSNVKTKQNIGRVGTNKESGETILHFELWSSKTNTPLNPQSWIH